MVIVTQTTKLLGLSMLIGLLIGFVFYLILPKQYETRALLDSGVAWNQARNQADGFDTIPIAIARVNTLKNQFFEEEKGFVHPYRFRYLRTQADPANARHLYIFLRADKPVSAQGELTRLLIEIVEDDVVIEDEIEIEDTESDEDLEIVEEDDEEVFMVVENMPEFPGGDLGLMKYIQKNVKYPPIAKEYNITGKVFISFVVDKSGSVTNVKVVRGVDKNLDAEAVRVIKSLPKYKPGKQRGKAVKVMFTVPINFTLN